MVFLGDIGFAELNKHYFPLHFHHPEYPKTLFDAFFDGFFVVRKLGIHDGFPCFYGDTGGGDFHGFYVVHELSFSLFRQAVADRVPSEG